MELRSSHRRHEYKELQMTLTGMGFYEEGMELQEMRQILDVLQINHRNLSPSSSPQVPSQTIVVQAEVHHPMNWSPTNDSSPRKRLASSPSSAGDDGISQQCEIINNLLEPNAKRFHEVRGPVSMRRTQDSGVNMSNEDELPSSSYNTSNETSNSSSNNEVGNDAQHRLQFSTSSAAMSDENEYFEDDLFENLEPSL